MSIPEWTDNDTKVLQILANTLTRQQKPDRAGILLEYALKKDPGNLSVKKALCGVYMLLENYDSALSMIDRVLEEKPREKDTEKLSLVRCEALWHSGKKEEAKNEMKKYISKRQQS